MGLGERRLGCVCVCVYVYMCVGECERVGEEGGTWRLSPLASPLDAQLMLGEGLEECCSPAPPGQGIVEETEIITGLTPPSLSPLCLDPFISSHLHLEPHPLFLILMTFLSGSSCA